jgi:hypothetical protein
MRRLANEDAWSMKPETALHPSGANEATLSGVLVALVEEILIDY